MKDQLMKLDLDIDWDREIATCNEDYYKHQQELFIDLYNAVPSPELGKFKI